MAKKNPANPIDPNAIKNMTQFAKALNLTRTEAKKVFAELNKTSKVAEKIKFKKSFFDDFSQIKKEAGSLTDVVLKLSGEIKKLSFDDALKSDKAKVLQDRLKGIYDEINNIGKDDSLEEQKEKFKDLKNEASKVEKEINKIKDNRIDFKITDPKQLTNVFQQISKTPDMMSVMGMAAKGLGKILGSVTKTLGGWPMAVLAGVKAFWDISKSADQFVKDANEAFASIRGPDIMTPNTRKQFKDFNNQIFNAGENIRVGLDPKEVRGFLESIAAAGANITTLNKGLGGYRDAVYVAAKASKTLGTSLPWVGNEVAGLINTFHMNMETIDKTFVQVAFDAKKSGLSTDRFWATVKNSTASLAFYGVTISGASKALKRFTEDAVGSAEDGAAATEDMWGAFKEGSLSTQAALLDFAGGASKTFKKMSEQYKSQREEIRTQVIDLTAKKEKTPADVEQLEKLRVQLADATAMSERYDKMQHKDAVIQATQMGALADDAPELIINGLTRMYGNIADIQGERMAVAISSVEKIGLKPKTVQMLVREGMISRNLLQQLVTETPELFTENNNISDESRKEISSAILTAGTTTGDAQELAGQNLSNLLVSILGVDKAQANLFTTVAEADADQTQQMADLLEKGNQESLNKLKLLITSGNSVKKVTVRRFKEEKKTSTQMAKGAEDTFNQIVDQTLSTNKILDIGKSEIEYGANSLGLFASINGAVADISKMLLFKTPGYQTQSQKLAQKNIALIIANNKEMKDLLKLTKDGIITSESQEAIMKKTVSNIANLDKMHDLLGKISDIQSFSGATDSFKKAATEAFSQGNMELGKSLIALRQDPEIVASLKELEGLQNDTSKDAGHQKKLVAAQVKYATIAKKKTQQMLKDNEASKNAQQVMQKSLISIDQNNETIANLEQLKLKTDPVMMGNVADTIEQQLAKGVSPEDISKNLKMPLDRMQNILEDQNRTASAKTIGDTIARTHPELVGQKRIPLGMRQAMTRPEMIKAPGAIALHQGETILPHPGRARTQLVPENKTAPVGGGASSKNITITVNATERDLGQKIADKINTALYNWQLAG